MTERKVGDATVLEVKGKLALDQGDQELSHRVAELIRGGQRKILLDLGGVTYMDSAGVTALISCYRQSQGAEGTLVLLRPSPQVRELLRITRLDDIFEILDSEAGFPSSS